MRRNFFLYLTLACFVGLIAIFVFDGYMGLYDTLHITTGEYEQTVEADHWDRYRDYKPLVETAWGDKALFSYEVNNRRFSSYVTAIQVSVWKEDAKIIDIMDEDRSIEPFDEAKVDWTLASQELEKVGLGIDNYTVKINHGDVERKIIVRFYSLEESGSPKILPPPPR
ncbi:hypothetical protein ES707_21535 [subsurface metagenome]